MLKLIKTFEVFIKIIKFDFQMSETSALRIGKNRCLDKSRINKIRSRLTQKICD